MKNLTTTLIAASFFLAGPAFAVEDLLEDSGSLIVKGHVPVKCTVTVGEGEIDMEHNPSPEQVYFFNGDIDLQCNSKLGASLTLESSNSGLAHKLSPDHTIDYGAWLQVFGQEQDTMGGIGGNFVELNIVDGDVTSNTLMFGQKDNNLAMGMVTAALSVSLNEPIKFAGEYEDTLTIAIAAKL